MVWQEKLSKINYSTAMLYIGKHRAANSGVSPNGQSG